MTRVLAVLGYSDRAADALHPECERRLTLAATLARPDDIVVLSGWARRGSPRSEAELMERRWSVDCALVVADPWARTTAENARFVAEVARRHAADEVLAVTSSWHAPRARLVFRATLRGAGVRVAVASRRDRRRLGRALAELARWPLVPLALALARRRRPR